MLILVLWLLTPSPLWPLRAFYCQKKIGVPVGLEDKFLVPPHFCIMHYLLRSSGVARAIELVGHHCACAKALTAPAVN